MIYHFLRFSKLDTLRIIRYIFISSILNIEQSFNFQKSPIVDLKNIFFCARKFANILLLLQKQCCRAVAGVDGAEIVLRIWSWSPSWIICFTNIYCTHTKVRLEAVIINKTNFYHHLHCRHISYVTIFALILYILQWQDRTGNGLTAFEFCAAKSRLWKKRIRISFIHSHIHEMA